MKRKSVHVHIHVRTLPSTGVHAVGKAVTKVAQACTLTVTAVFNDLS